MAMRILYFSQYFPPEIGATQTRAYEMASRLVKMGHHVTMITEVPNHPKGIIRPEFRGRLFIRENMDGIDVIRVWVKTSTVKNFRNRILFYMSYMINALISSIIVTRGAFDLIYATSPPLFVGGSALIASILKRKPLVFEVRDLWPESAVALNEISNPRYIALATKLEEKCYRHARKIIVVTNGIYQRLVERGIIENKLVLITNGANVDLFQFRQDARSRTRNELGLNNKFVAIYAGIFGIAQGLDTIVKAADRLGDKPEIFFLLIGEGPTKNTILDLISEFRLNNIQVLPEQAREDIPDYLSGSDVAIIPLKKLDIFKGALPSKMFDAWACERPLILSVDGEARRILDEVRGGVYVPPEDPIKMAEAILNLSYSKINREQMGLTGRAYTIKNYSRAAMADKLESVLLEII